MGLRELPVGLITFKSTVSYLDSLSLMTSADGLLVIDAPAATSVFLPSKLIDYIGSGTPILGITPSGTAAKLITELGGWVSDPANSNTTEEVLKSFIVFLRQHGRRPNPFWGNPQIRKEFEASIVGQRFEQIVYELLRCR